MTQPARLLNYLERHGSITRLEASRELGVMNLWSRIADLERLGCVIRRDDGVKVQDRFGNKCVVTRYTLISAPQVPNVGAAPTLSGQATRLNDERSAVAETCA